MDINVSAPYFCVPVNGTAPAMRCVLRLNGKIVRYFTCCPCSPEAADFHAVCEVAEWRGQTLAVEFTADPAGVGSTDAVDLPDPAWFTMRDDVPPVVHDPLRPLWHFASSQGWINDPNGLFYFDGLYHLFYQHNPFSVKWGPMHWGHAVSTDLLRWRHEPVVLYPDEAGIMYSGCAVVDHQNTSGLQRGSTPPILLFYTSAGGYAPVPVGYTQNIAVSVDGGKTFRKYPGNPALSEIAPGNRDPKVVWHPQERRWLMALFLQGEEEKQRFAIYTSQNLLKWTLVQELVLLGSGECPDLFPLTVREEGITKWIFSAADGAYLIGDFQEGRFVAESEQLQFYHRRGNGDLYAAQTWDNLAEGRRVQIAWQTGAVPSSVFNMSLGCPVELSLRCFSDGLRLCAEPVRELSSLVKSNRIESDFMVDDHGFQTETQGEAIDFSLQVDGVSSFALTMRGVRFTYDAAERALRMCCPGCEEESLAHSLRERELNLRILIDRIGCEVFFDRGRGYVGRRVLFDPQHRIIGLSGASVHVRELRISELAAISVQ